MSTDLFVFTAFNFDLSTFHCHPLDFAGDPSPSGDDFELRCTPSTDSLQFPVLKRIFVHHWRTRIMVIRRS